MLFVESRTLSSSVEGTARIALLEQLRQDELVPLIRSARLEAFDHALSGLQRIGEMESAIASWTESQNQGPYVRGDVFCLEDHCLFLIFDTDTGPSPLIRAGVIYEERTVEPFRKLDAFCRLVRDILFREREGDSARTEVLPEWQTGKPLVPDGFRRFVAKQDRDSLFTSLRKETMRERIRAASILENEATRVFLRYARDARVEGYAGKLLTGETAGSGEFSVEKLENAGLVERGVQVSCRKTGHALFQLPTAHALAVVTVSEARCSECGSSVADEVVEEVVAPTRLASTLLEDGSWLVSRLHQVLHELGVPEREIAIGPSDGVGHGQLMANICGEAFLLVARDGDLSPAFARRAIDLEIETESAHLVIIATGRFHNHARVLLHDHAQRRVATGRDFELIVTSEPEAASSELHDACERVSQRIIDEQLCELDAGLGLSISRMIITKFKLVPNANVTESDEVRIPENEQHPDAGPPLALAAYASAASGDPTSYGQAIPNQAPDHELNQVEESAAILNSGSDGWTSTLG